MPRARTGTLVFDPVLRSYKARITVRHANGSTTRPWFCLNTADLGTAERLKGELVRHHEHTPGPPPTRFEPYAMAWLEAREARGVAQAESERGWLKNHILPKLGALYLADVRPVALRELLDAVAKKNLGRQTLVHVRATVRGILGQAWRDEIIPENPVDKVKVPDVRETRKERVILTDHEIATLFACDAVAIELRMLVLVARVEGGMRTRDLTAWAWTMVDLDGFAWCVVPRTKTGKPQRLEIPDVLRAPLREWWEQAKRPKAGAVFPVTRGARKGEARKARGVSFADRLRRALLTAGLDRHDLHHETEWSLPVDFHSCRRAFATALADAGVEGRRAMHLTGHADEKAHRRYVMETAPMRTIPEAAVPRLLAPVGPQRGANRLRIVPDLGASCDFFERDTRFELATLSLGSRGGPLNTAENRAIPRVPACQDRPGSVGIGPESSAIVPAQIEALRASGRAIAVEALGWRALDVLVLEGLGGGEEEPR